MANADEKVFLWINGLAGNFTPVDRFMQWAVSDYLIPVSMALALVGLWFVGNDKLTRQRHQIGVFIALTAMGLSNLSILIINQFYFRPRPFDPLADLDVKLLFYPPTDSSFPSNAVAAAFGIAFSVWGVNHRIGTGFIVGASLYAFARIYAGVHYPLDVIGGAFIALVLTLFVFRLRDLLQPLPNWVIKAARILCLA